ncbi:hypothetical protein J4211_01165 [Candidatus Woesearchaeota archaeon]|nr:hypothetical protein [Candidatus Woesearchaeota archaeon]
MADVHCIQCGVIISVLSNPNRLCEQCNEKSILSTMGLAKNTIKIDSSSQNSNNHFSSLPNQNNTLSSEKTATDSSQFTQKIDKEFSNAQPLEKIKTAPTVQASELERDFQKNFRLPDGSCDVESLTEFVENQLERAKSAEKSIKKLQIVYAVKYLEVAYFDELRLLLGMSEDNKSKLHDWLKELEREKAITNLDFTDIDVQNKQEYLRFVGQRSSKYYKINKDFYAVNRLSIEVSVAMRFKQLVTERITRLRKIEKEHQAVKLEKALLKKERESKKKAVIIRIKEHLAEHYIGMKVTPETIQEIMLSFGKDLRYNKARAHLDFLVHKDKHSIIIREQNDEVDCFVVKNKSKGVQ